MSYRITGNEKVTVGTTAKDIKIGYRAFSLMNNGESAIYFHSRDSDGKAVTAASGMALKAGEVFRQVLTCDALSVISDATGGDLRILYLDVG